MVSSGDNIDVSICWLIETACYLNVVFVNFVINTCRKGRNLLVFLNGNHSVTIVLRSDSWPIAQPDNVDQSTKAVLWHQLLSDNNIDLPTNIQIWSWFLMQQLCRNFFCNLTIIWNTQSWSRLYILKKTGKNQHVNSTKVTMHSFGKRRDPSPIWNVLLPLRISATLVFEE